MGTQVTSKDRRNLGQIIIGGLFLGVGAVALAFGESKWTYWVYAVLGGLVFVQGIISRRKERVAPQE